jgi:hypothetical protein
MASSSSSSGQQQSKCKKLNVFSLHGLKLDVVALEV